MIRLLTLLLFINFYSEHSFAVPNERPKKILISKVIEHNAINQTVSGIIDALKNEGYVQGKNIDIRVESAQGNMALASQIAGKFMGQDADAIIGVGTISAQSFIKYARDNKVKLVFSSVTDPHSANLSKANDELIHNITGVSNFVDLEPQIKMFKVMQPTLRTLGIIYNPTEMNSVIIVKKLGVICEKHGIKLIKQTVNKSADIVQIAVKLVNQVDAIFISNDNTALSALPTIIRAANNVNIPVYVSDTDAVELGALAALGPNQYQVGIQTGKIVASLLKGKSITTVPIEYPTRTELYINTKTAQKLKITVPPSLIKYADHIIGR